ncbi:MAG TPA: hypothetical protein VK590_04820 [Saprospiraceae bacterium]|nr:hypothetical protein [Saprospiraceae bacterium]
MKYPALVIFVLLILAYSVQAQRISTPTDTLKISGKIKTELKYSLQQLDTFSVKIIGDIAITNQEGIVRRTAKNLKGIPIKSLLNKIDIEVDKPKFLNEYYFIFVASDGYKVVFSWNEIFNTEIGDNIFIITESEGTVYKDSKERILTVSAKDIGKGRRYIKNLEKIIVARVE